MAAVSEISLRQGASSPLGFRLTGGSQFSMPLTVFEVSEGGRAHRAGVRPGDVLLRIDGADATDLSLSDAHRIISAAGDSVKLSICNLDDQELTENEELIKASVLSASEDTGADDFTNVSSEQDLFEAYKELNHEVFLRHQNIENHCSEYSVEKTQTRQNKINFDVTSRTPEKSNIGIASKIENDNIVVDNTARTQKQNRPMATSQDEFEEEQYVDVRSLPLRPPQPAPKPEKAQRRCWHPVMWETSPPPDANAEEELPPEEAKRREYPHKQRIRNLRRLMAEGKIPRPICDADLCDEESENLEDTPGLSETKKIIHCTISDSPGVSSRFSIKIRKDVVMLVKNRSVARRQLAALRRQAAALEQLPEAVGAVLQAFTAHLDALLTPPEAVLNCNFGRTPSPVPSPTRASESELDTSELESYTIQSELSTEDNTEVVEDESSESAGEMEHSDTPPLESNTENETSSSSDSTKTQRSYKQHKMDLLNKTWPWADENKPIYKIADHYEPVYARCINKKVKWLEERITQEQIYVKKLKIRR